MRVPYREAVYEWFTLGVEQKATHLITVSDAFTHEQYPVFVKPDEDVREKVDAIDGKEMQKVLEVYNLSMDKEKQLAETRPYNL